MSSDDSSHANQNAVKQKLALAYKSNLAENLKAQVAEVDDRVNINAFYNNNLDRWSTTWLQQVTVLLRRGVKERRHDFFSALKIGQVIAVAFLCSLLWWQSDKTHLQDQV